MAQPKWITPAGTLGTFPSSTPITIQLTANPVNPATLVSYKLLNGNLPAPMTLDYLGFITGTPDGVNVDTINTFTVRVTDEFDNIADRTFTITISTAALPKFTAPNGIILSVNDSTYVDYTVLYTTPVADDTTKIILTTGSLPDGLVIDTAGRITGYAAPPVTTNGSPTIIVYNFTLSLVSALGTVTANYGVEVINFQLTNPPNTRPPVILNSNPLVSPVPTSDPYYDYYVSDFNIPIIQSADFFSFKVIGYDFDGSSLGYTFSAMPPGLIGNTTTGWVSGIPVINKGLSSFQFQTLVYKKSNQISSQVVTFTVTISNQVVPDVIWQTPADLGVVFNNTICDLNVKATSAQSLIYRITSGSLPGNLTLASDGQLMGKVAFQPTSSLSSVGDSNTFTFTVEAISPEFNLVAGSRTFTLTVYQLYETPTENIYFSAAPSLPDRAIIASLLNNDQLIPPDYIYRPNDINFGKASKITFVQAYGIDVSTIEEFIQVVQQNHYNRQIILGELKTAVAKDAFGNIIYEVVYSEIQDDLVNSKGVSVPKQIRWPVPISQNLGPWITSTGEVYTAFDKNTKGEKAYYSSLSPGYTQILYPASLINMRNRAATILGQNFDSGLLPRWMATQQSNSSILGYVQAWVVCYTKPGKAQEILDNINNNWVFQLNDINFVVDRYTIDNSSTFNYNADLEVPAWNQLPSGFPTPDPIDSQDFYALFPQKTILPK